MRNRPNWTIEKCSICGKEIIIGLLAHEVECAKKKQRELDEKFRRQQERKAKTGGICSWQADSYRIGLR